MSNIAVPADEQTLTIVREKLGLSSNDLEQIMEQPWFGAAVKEAWRESQKIAKVERISSNLSKYIHNPIGFCTDYLGVTFIEAVQKSPVVIAKSGNAVGKSHSAARIAVWYYLVHKDAKVFMTAAPPLENLMKILWAQVMGISRRHPELFIGHRIRAMDIRRHDESFMTAVAIPITGDSHERESKFSGKHSGHLMFVVDEGDAVPDEVYKGIESCMSGGDTKLLIMFNPRAKSGAVYIKETSGEAHIVEISAINHPNVITGADVIPGAVSRETVIRRINQWSRPLHRDEKPDENCFEMPEFLVGISAVGQDGREYPPLQAGWRKVTQAELWYMVFGRYPAQSEQHLISEAWITLARARWDQYVADHGELPPPGKRPIAGLDLAEFGGDYNFLALRYGGWVPNMEFWAGMDTDASADKALEMCLKKNVDICNVDGNGIGSGVAPAMARRKGIDDDLITVAVKTSEKPSPIYRVDEGEFGILRDQLAWRLRDWLKDDPQAMLPPDQMLLEELRIAKYHPQTKTRKITLMDKDMMRKLLKRSPDRFDALCLTFNFYTRPTWSFVDETK